VITSTSITRVLSVTHHVPGLTGHAERAHPHLWTVRGEFTGDPLPGEGMAVVPHAQADTFRKLLNEYQGGFINDLVGPGIPSLEGFALHLMERCSGALPTLRRIAVFDAHHDPSEQRTFIVER
jgi:6-pyruvoyl-tetrahydropterin synthase